jgi:hypothetical protein
LLLGILRESPSIAARFLLAHDINLTRARETVAVPSGSQIDREKIDSQIGWARIAGRRYWIGAVAQLGRILGPSSFFWSFGNHSRAGAKAMSYALLWLYSIFMFG